MVFTPWGLRTLRRGMKEGDAREGPVRQRYAVRHLRREGVGPEALVADAERLSSIVTMARRRRS